MISERTASRWRFCVPGIGAPTPLRSWLREPDSLTARLQRSGEFRLKLLAQRLLGANRDEEAALGLAPRARCWVREVLLHCDGRPVVFAHTVLPAEPRGVLGRWFDGLGGRSLGSLLFAHPGFRRGPLAFARIDRRHPLYARAAAALGVSPACFHARRCTHGFGPQKILVTEIFCADIGQESRCDGRAGASAGNRGSMSPLGMRRS